MSFKKSKVCTAVLTALGGAVALSSIQVHAQDSGAVVNITGSRILQSVLSSAPVAEVSAEDFRLSGTTRVEDLLVTLPQLSASFDSFTVNPTTGFPTADLRGLGTQRTLVLVNGNRLQPGGIRSEAADLSQIPVAVIKRVDILTGGASAVYGADAMAGVVNFILDNEFEGFSANIGWSGYQHDNRSSYLQGLMDARGFSYPTGNSGPDGDSENVDLAWGSRFAEGKGHAMAYVTWRKNEELRQGARDYSSCALNAAGTACGGSGTSVQPNFLVQGTLLPPRDLTGDGKPETTYGYRGARQNPDGTWTDGSPPPYNYAPINHYQRPDERWNFGGTLKYEINENFIPYVETMFTSTRTSVQIAESGTFFVNDPAFTCADPLLGTMCADLGLDPTVPLEVYVGKRNVEGGPRISEIESNSFRVVVGSEGALGLGSWFYNVSYLYGRNSSNEANVNDFLTDRLDAALRGCPAGSFDGCVPYNVWTPGGVTADAAAALAGTGMRTGATSLQVFNAYVTGDFGYTLPTARNPISLVVGTEFRSETYDVRSDSNMESANFTGLGGPRLPVSGETRVRELFVEAQVPTYAGTGFVKSFDLDLGYRLSDYNISGNVNTYKLGFNSNHGMFRARGGYNRAIRAPNINELFSQGQIALWQGSDPCAGAAPTLTEAQCANTGVTAAQYGNVPRNSASQYNQFIAGNPNLEPETGDTWTLGLVATPIKGLTATADYWDIKITDRIGENGSQLIVETCALTADPFYCGKVNRNASSGDLWIGSSLATSGYVENPTLNAGDYRYRGLDLALYYTMPLMKGQLSTSISGTYLLEAETAPLPGVNDSATYDCAGKINSTCADPDNAKSGPKWKHTASARYSQDWWTANLRWRYIGAMDYDNTDGTPGTTDQLLVRNGGKLSAWNYLDVSAAFDIGKFTTLTVGVNNIADKAPPMVGADLSLNANAPGGYDQLGRYLFANVGVRF